MWTTLPFFQPYCFLPPPRLIIFDFDNTLVHSWPQLYQTWNAFEAMKGWPISSIPEMQALPPTTITDLSPADYQRYQRCYLTAHKNPPPLVSGCKSLLQSLQQWQIPTVILSDLDHLALKRLTKKLQIDTLVNQIRGRMPDEPKKPHWHALEKLSLSLEPSPSTAQRDIWCIGDMPCDIQLATDNQLFPVWASALTRPKERGKIVAHLHEKKVNHLEISHLSQLERIISKFSPKNGISNDVTTHFIAK